MIVVRVELHSAITKRVQNLGTVYICNDGTGGQVRRNYDAFAYRKGARLPRTLEEIVTKAQRKGRVEDHPAPRVSIWTLVRKALQEMRY